MDIKKYIHQPIDGLLYDLDLMPEQTVDKPKKRLTGDVITELQKQIFEVLAENKKLKKRLIKAQVFERDDLTPEAKKTFDDIDKALKQTKE